MERRCILLFLIAQSAFLLAQSGFRRQYYTTDTMDMIAPFGAHVHATDSGYLLSAMVTKDHNTYTIRMTAVDSMGQPGWSRDITGPPQHFIRIFRSFPLADGTHGFVGQYEDHAFYLRVDANGIPMHAHQYVTFSSSHWTDVQPLSDTAWLALGYLVTGLDSLHGQSAVLHSNGGITNLQRIRPVQEEGAILRSATHPSGGVVTIGDSHPVIGNIYRNYASVMRLDTTGQVLWSTMVTNADGEIIPRAITTLPDGSVVTAFAASPVVGYPDSLRMVICEFDAFGALEWAMEYDEPVGYRPDAISLHGQADGSILVAGISQSLWPFLMRVAADGSVLDARHVITYGLGQETMDGGLAVGSDKLLLVHTARSAGAGDTPSLLYSPYPPDLVCGDAYVAITAVPFAPGILPLPSTTSAVPLVLVEVTQFLTHTPLSILTAEPCLPTAASGIDRPVEMCLTPNPATDLVRISGTDLEQVELVDTMGRKVLEERTDDARSTELDVHALPPGLYHVRAWDGERWMSGSLVKE